MIFAMMKSLPTGSSIQFENRPDGSIRVGMSVVIEGARYEIAEFMDGRSEYGDKLAADVLSQIRQQISNCTHSFVRAAQDNNTTNR